MNEAIFYLLKVLAIQGALFLLYWLILKRSSRHAMNRYFLMGSLIVSFFIPFIEFPTPLAEVQESYETPISIITWISEPVQIVQELEFVPVKQESSSFSVWSFTPYLYVLITLLLLSRSVFYLMVLYRLKRNSESIPKRGFTLFKTAQGHPFSFLFSVFIPGSLFESSSFKQILSHEYAHVRQLHSLDRIFSDFLIALFWFNPIIYLYRNAIIEIHEYQADEEVVKRYEDRVGYQEALFSQLQTSQYSGLVSHFNVKLVKKRIIMMNKRKKMTAWLYVLTVPLILLLIFAFSSKEAMHPLQNAGTEISGMIGPIEDMRELASNFVLQDNTEDNIPKLQPIRNEDLTRLASGFGKRIHPVLKVEKMHLGIDFTCKLGSEVMATANGVVEMIESSTDGYGKHIVINHGNEFKTTYAHLSAFDVKEGDQVTTGQVIGLSGNSGDSAQPHLHYEVEKAGKHVDPLDYLEGFKPKKIKKKTAKKLGSLKEEQHEKERLFAKEEKEKAMLEAALAERERELAKKEKESALKLAKEAELMKAEVQRELKKTGKQGFRVIIDAGHGGHDPGAISPSGLKESEVALSIARWVGENLDKNDFEIVFTRDKDEFISIQDRAEMLQGADLFVSIHTDNYSKKEDSFVLPIYYEGNEYSEESHDLASKLCSEFNRIGKETKVGTIYEYKPQEMTEYDLLGAAKCPAVLLNVGFFSNPDEENYLSKEESIEQIAGRIESAIRSMLL